MRKILLGFAIFNFAGFLSAEPGYYNPSGNCSQCNHYPLAPSQNTGSYSQGSPQSDGRGNSQYAPNYTRQNGSNSSSRGAQQNSYFQNDSNYSSTSDSNNNSAKSSVNDRYATDDDRKLGKQIRDAITGGWFSKGYDNLNLDINQGRVTISGTVPTQEDISKISDTLKSNKDIKSLNLQLSVNPNTNNARSSNTSSSSDLKNPNDHYATDADRDLVIKIRKEITGWFTDKYKNVSISAYNGEVVLEGSVDSLDDAHKAVDEIQKINGVDRVNNRLQVNDTTH